MAQNTVNTGTTANDGTGDTLRAAFIKINDDITEIFFNVANNTSNIANLVVSVDTADGELLALSSIAFDTANQAYDFSNAQYTAMNAAFTMANTVNSLFYGAVVNSAAAFAMANSTVVRTNAVYTLTNSSFNVANAAFNLANTLDPTASGARQVASFDRANLAFQLAGEAFDMANAGVSLALGAIANVESSYGFANGVSVNTAASYRVANSGYNVTNVAYGATNTCYYKTNSCYSVSNSAYNTANTKVNTINGIVTGVFTVEGNVKVQGTTNLFEIINGNIYVNGVLWNPVSPGTVIYSAASTAPDGYLIADGSAVSRSTYSALFSAINTTYGSGNGTTTFNLPDLRGTFIRGLDRGKGLDSGRTLGSYQDDGVGPLGINDPGHAHMQTGSKIQNFWAGVDNSSAFQARERNTFLTEPAYTGVSVSGTISETRPKNYALLACIKY
jgi:microcystin-dependent protein